MTRSGPARSWSTARSTHPKIEIHPNTAVDEVLGDDKVDGLRLRDTVDRRASEMPIEGLFIAIGYEPNTAAFRDWLEVDEKGYLVVHDETGSQDRRRVHRRRRPRPSLPPGGHGGRRRLQGRDRCRALARGPGDHRSRDRDRLVSFSARRHPSRDRRESGAVARVGRRPGWAGRSAAVRPREFTPVAQERRGATMRRILAFFRPYRLAGRGRPRSRSSSTSFIGLVNPYPAQAPDRRRDPAAGLSAQPVRRADDRPADRRRD